VRLKTLLRQLEETLLQSRELFERCLQSLPEQVLNESWQRSERTAASSGVGEQFVLDFSGGSSASGVSAFQAADRPGEYRVIRPVTKERQRI
jgi:hypothetical protein